MGVSGTFNGVEHPGRKYMHTRTYMYTVKRTLFPMDNINSQCFVPCKEVVLFSEIQIALGKNYPPKTVLVSLSRRVHYWRFYCTYAHTHLHTGYNYYKAVTIPKGSANIHVTEISPSHNVIAAYSSISEEFKNGNFKILPTGMSSFFFAGSSWVYERPSHGAEYFETEGPIDENVTFLLLANSSYAGIRYSFSVPHDAIYLLSNATYFWNTTSWNECSVKCGKGERSRVVVCMKLYPSGEREEVDSSLCDPATRPEAVETCEQSPCLYEWNVTEWSICSSVCGQGQQVRHTHCELVNAGSKGPVVVQDSLCNQEEKPTLSQVCFVEDCQYNWHYGDWSDCDSHCGEGWKNREVVCLWMNLWLNNGAELRAATVSDSHCDLGARPEEKVICYAESCSNFQWLTTEWTQV